MAIDWRKRHDEMKATAERWETRAGELSAEVENKAKALEEAARERAAKFASDLDTQSDDLQGGGWRSKSTLIYSLLAIIAVALLVLFLAGRASAAEVCAPDWPPMTHIRCDESRGVIIVDSPVMDTAIATPHKCGRGA